MNTTDDHFQSNSVVTIWVVYVLDNIEYIDSRIYRSFDLAPKSWSRLYVRIWVQPHNNGRLTNTTSDTNIGGRSPVNAPLTSSWLSLLSAYIECSMFRNSYHYPNITHFATAGTKKCCCMISYQGGGYEQNEVILTCGCLLCRGDVTPGYSERWRIT